MADSIKPKLPHKTDGYVFTPVRHPYMPGSDQKLLKWKPLAENSIDFMLRTESKPAQSGMLPEFIGHLCVKGERNQLVEFSRIYPSDRFPKAKMLYVVHHQRNFASKKGFFYPGSSMARSSSATLYPACMVAGSGSTTARAKTNPSPTQTRLPTVCASPSTAASRMSIIYAAKSSSTSKDGTHQSHSRQSCSHHSSRNNDYV